jgi:predicted transcriptional regulator
MEQRAANSWDILFRRGESTAAQILAEMPDPPSYSAIRALLRILVEKRHLQHCEDGPRYVMHRQCRDRKHASARDAGGQHVLRRISAKGGNRIAQLVAAKVDQIRAGRVERADRRRTQARAMTMFDLWAVWSVVVKAGLLVAAAGLAPRF